MIERFVAFWDSRETPETLAWLRIAMPLVVLTDLLHARWLGIHRVMWSPIGEGGWSVTAASADEIPMIMQVFGATTEVATGTFWATCLACMLLASGTFSRTSALALVLLWAQLEDMLPVADRAIDRLYRNLLLVLAFSGAGRAWSVDAWLSTGSWRGSGDVVGGWARRLFILQVTWMYLDAGLEKTAASWSIFGSYDALYIILQDPIISRFDFSGLGPIFHGLTRVGTAGSVWWEMLFPLVAVQLFVSDPRPEIPRRQRIRRLARWLRAHHAREVWLAVGLCFHLALWFTLELGMFPLAMMVLYPCFYGPEELPVTRAPQSP